MRSWKRERRRSRAERGGHERRLDRAAGAGGGSPRAGAIGDSSFADSNRADPRSAVDRGRTYRPELRATSGERSRPRVLRRRAQRSTRGRGRASSAENALPRDERREDRQGALAAPPVGLEAKPPEPLEPDGVDDARRQPHAPRELIEDPSDADRRAN